MEVLGLGLGVEDEVWGAGLAPLSTVESLGLGILRLEIIRVMDSQGKTRVWQCRSGSHCA